METLRKKLFGAFVIASGFLIGLNPVLAQEQDFEDTIIYTDASETTNNTSAKETTVVEVQEEQKQVVTETQTSQNSSEVTKSQDAVTEQKTLEQETSAPANAPNSTKAEATRDVESDEESEAPEEDKVVLIIKDNRTGEYEETIQFTFDAGERMDHRLLNMQTIFNLATTSTTSYKDGDTTYTFKGWYLDEENNNPLENTSGVPDNSYKSGFSRFSLKSSNINGYNFALYMVAATNISGTQYFYLYGDWEVETIEHGNAVLIVEDNRTGEYKETARFEFDENQTMTYTDLNLQTIFGLKDTSTISYIDGDTSYTFNGWYLDEKNNNPLENTSGVPDDSYKSGFSRFSLKPSNINGYNFALYMTAAKSISGTQYFYLYGDWSTSHVGTVTINIEEKLKDLEEQTETENDTGKKLITKASDIGSTRMLFSDIFDKPVSYEENEYIYTFKGWYDINDNLIDSDYVLEGDYNVLSYLGYSTSDNYYMSLEAEALKTLNVDKELLVYGVWEKTPVQKPHTVTYHILEDTRKGYEGEESYKTENTFITDYVTHTNVFTIDSYAIFNSSTVEFIEDGETKVVYYPHFSQEAEIHIDHEEGVLYPQIDVSNSPVIYYLKGWKDSEGKIIGSEGYKLPEYESRIISSIEVLVDNKPSTSTHNYSLQINYKPLSEIRAKGYNNEDYDITFTPIFEGFTTAVLNSYYIDEVSTGSTSAGNPSGGVVTYTHTFSNPEEGTPGGLDDYDFKYWKFEEPEGEDDPQIDTEKEYVKEDQFEYDLFWKPDQWTGTATAYAWYQPIIRINVYKELGSGDVKSQKASEDTNYTVSLNKKPESYGFTKPGYDFVGWYMLDEEGNKIPVTFEENQDILVFEAASLTKERIDIPVYNVYADWERITEDITITKVWEDNDDEREYRPNLVNVSVVNNEEVEETASYELTADDKVCDENGTCDNNVWSKIVTIFKFDTEGNPLTYVLDEKEMDCYNTTINQETYTVTNTLKADGKVTIKYLDKDDTSIELAPTIVIEDTIDRPYTSEQLEIDKYDFYELVITPETAEANGKITETPIEIIYYYEKAIGYIRVHHVDENGDYISRDKNYELCEGGCQVQYTYPWL